MVPKRKNKKKKTNPPPPHPKGQKKRGREAKTKITILIGNTVPGQQKRRDTVTGNEPTWRNNKQN